MPAKTAGGSIAEWVVAGSSARVGSGSGFSQIIVLSLLDTLQQQLNYSIK
jgi:hypothetical protein